MGSMQWLLRAQTPQGCQGARYPLLISQSAHLFARYLGSEVPVIIMEQNPQGKLTFSLGTAFLD